MDTIDKWLKSLRLHKYTHLFKNLTYDQMLNLEESYLIDKEVTKGARNKMLVSIKKLNLRQERLINMVDDLNQDSISMKEALTVLKDMLITPIPSPHPQPSPLPHSVNIQHPSHHNQNHLLRPIQPLPPTPPNSTTKDNLRHQSVTSSGSSTTSSGSSSASSTTSSSSSCSSSSISGSSCISGSSSISAGYLSISPLSPQSLSPAQSPSSSSQSLNPYELTYLFIETLEKVVSRLIESAGLEDTACHGIVTTILDECLKHNSFTMEQKAKVAGFKHYFMMGQKPRVANYNNHHHHNHYNHHHHNNHHQKQHFAITNINTTPTGISSTKATTTMTTPTTNSIMGQKSKSASIKQQHFTFEQQHKSRSATIKQQQQQFTFEQQLRSANIKQHFTNIEQKSKSASFRQHHAHQLPSHLNHINHLGQSQLHHQQHQHWDHQTLQQQQLLHQQQQEKLDHCHQDRQSPRSPTSTTDGYKEYSLLGPGTTFELPYLRALDAKHQQRHQQQASATNSKVATAVAGAGEAASAPDRQLSRYAFVTSDPVGWNCWL